MREVRVLTLRYPMFANSADGQQDETSWLVQRCRSTLCSVQCAVKGIWAADVAWRSQKRKKAGHLCTRVCAPSAQ